MFKFFKKKPKETSIEEIINKQEGIFKITGKKNSQSSECCFILDEFLNYATNAKIEAIVETSIPSEKIDKGTLLLLINKQGEGIGKFPRVLSEEEKSKVLGNKIFYSESKRFYFEDMGLSASSSLNSYEIKVIEGQYAGFFLKEILENQIIPSKIAYEHAAQIKRNLAKLILH